MNLDSKINLHFKACNVDCGCDYIKPCESQASVICKACFGASTPPPVVDMLSVCEFQMADFGWTAAHPYSGLYCVATLWITNASVRGGQLVRHLDTQNETFLMVSLCEAIGVG